ncbi:cysteine dioxygenase [Francisella philomiragia]|uniref:cysteine dioxygenase n=1 Tax=Francisella philomiragia TaxID=28110 RepID=UPI00190552CB|nr:cysteine dioxygenase family protein [Francisella philomiragia]MBK2267774.1 cysteine dioxygenase family protein [Francisella philomiragia]MBK2279127.1 cysteine dioxygenase family protein [Francisella philomiragia]MBK2287084.1 cysteine dioxygenase family protein [Francisella philomiragia]MBK2288959.1 cysteine dioxygenase family protein [Francisella philomiragia]MBK2290677.1 cysteine dioxygenase family protein [Francisella philomiragia]
MSNKLKLIKERCKSNQYDLKVLIKQIISLIDDDLLNLCCNDSVKYTRTSLYNDSLIEVLLLRWPPGSRSYIHDHDLQKCCVSLIQGRLINVLYGFSRDEFAALSESEVKRGYIYEAKDTEIHSIQNRGLETAYSLHIYSKPVKKCKIYSKNGEYEIKELSYDKVL